MFTLILLSENHILDRPHEDVPRDLQLLIAPTCGVCTHSTNDVVWLDSSILLRLPEAVRDLAALVRKTDNAIMLLDQITAITIPAS